MTRIAEQRQSCQTGEARQARKEIVGGNMDGWKFEDPRNLAVISTRKIFHGGGWIGYASHDADDESWQFYGNEAEIDQDDLILVGLVEIVELDETVAQLADLPLGWHARRDTKSSPWRRSKKPLEPPEGS